MMTTAGSCTEFARDIKQFVSRCAERLEQNILVEGQLPPVVRGQRLAQSHRDKRPHMGGSSAENGSHYAAFLALLREGDAALYPTDLGKRVLASVKTVFRATARSICAPSGAADSGSLRAVGAKTYSGTPSTGRHPSGMFAGDV